MLSALGLVLNIGPGGVTRAELIEFFSLNIPESEIASCMASAGFDYTPGPTPEQQVDDDVRFTMSSADYAKTYGLGVSGWELGIIPMRLGDPNADKLAGLSAAQQDAFQQSKAACQGVWDEDRRARSDALNIAANEYREIVAADQRVIDALATWRACLAAGGYTFSDPEAMMVSLYERMNVGHENLDHLFADEVSLAIVNEPCEVAYNGQRREVIVERFAEFRSAFEAALASGQRLDAQG
jgi:hypothetical protein